MKRQTIVPTFDDNARIQQIFRLNPDSIIYAKEDHEIVYIENKYERFVSSGRWNVSVDELASLMREFGDQYSYSSPSSFASSLWKKTFNKSDTYFPVSFENGIPDHRTKMFRAALYGSRCEVLRYGKYELNQYDINSSFAHSASTINFPHPKTCEYAKEPSLSHILTHEGVSTVVFSQRGNLPVLPKRFMQRTVYAECERTEGTYTHNELRYALEAGVVIHEVKKQYIFLRSQDNPFSRFVDYCYTRRFSDENAKVWKRVLVSLFGRLAVMDNIMLQFRQAKGPKELIDTPRRLKHYYGVNCIATEVQSRGNGNVCWASMILADARSRIHKDANFWSAHYIDTDCFMVKERANVSLSQRLGDYKHAYGEYEIRGAKQYRVTFGEQSVVKLKGVSKRDNGRLDKFFAARVTQERLLNEDGTTSPYYIGENNETNIPEQIPNY